jgi:hypothetical protein
MHQQPVRQATLELLGGVQVLGKEALDAEGAESPLRALETAYQAVVVGVELDAGGPRPDASRRGHGRSLELHFLNPDIS